MNHINYIPKSRVGKLLIGTALSLTVALSAGTLLSSTQTAYAATSTKSSTADNVIALGKKYIGVNYKFGAQANSTSTFDCSSFTQYVFKQNGISIPRSSKQQSKAGTYVSRAQLQPGDLVFSDTNRDGVINHVSIYIGNDQLLHTYRVGIGVTISKFSGSAWDKTYVTARRVIPSNGQPEIVNPPVVTPPVVKPPVDTSPVVTPPVVKPPVDTSPVVTQPKPDKKPDHQPWYQRPSHDNDNKNNNWFW
ncbi:C40 family peptidase [Cohnella abietis]|uniref:NlpC/P60 domain-containing protein n=1 Tax=Cohnella abietis TaxID=2507935 RepID=A0A3T1D847_9BACL|nr:hypothetical protein KCTCHS21_36240 [Cohnella abietis]